MRVLFVSSLASAARTARAAGAAGAAGVWSRTLSRQVRMNSWKKSFGGAKEAGAGVSTGPGAGGPRVGLPQRTGGIVERREVEWRAGQRTEMTKKRADLPCLPNGLAEPLWELLEL